MNEAVEPMPVENPYAGSSAVVLDIGGDVGALIVTMPPALAGVEVEIVPSGTSRVEHLHAHADGTTHAHGPDGGHRDAHGVGHLQRSPAAGLSPAVVGEPGAPTPHVAVVVRPLPDGRRIPSLVFGAVLAGRYDLYVRPDGPVALTVDVAGAGVTEVDWPV